MIKTKKWQEAEAESSINMHTEDWMADEIDSLRDELASVYQQHAELLEALKRFTAYGKVFAYRTADGCPYDQAMEAIEKCDQ